MTASPVMLTVFVVVLLLAGPVEADSAERPEDKLEPVPPEEYPIYDLVVQKKFLTSQATLVLIHKLTATRLHPQEKAPPPRTFFEENGLFEGMLQPEVIDDFLLKISRPWKLDARFNFGVRYRIVSEEDAGRPEVSLAPMPAALRRVEHEDTAPPVIGLLEFSRVGFNRRENQALVYVAENRPDASGGGFLILLRRQGRTWEIVDTEVLWVAQPEEDRSSLFVPHALAKSPLGR